MQCLGHVTGGDGADRGSKHQTERVNTESKASLMDKENICYRNRNQRFVGRAAQTKEDVGADEITRVLSFGEPYLAGDDNDQAG